MRWPQTTAVVTGATRGIGRAVVAALVGSGASVGCVARSRDDLVSLQQELAAQGRIEIAPANVGVRSEIESALDALSGALGRVDVLVNNAGIGLYGPVARLDPDDAERLMRVNYLGTVYATSAVLPQMLQRRSGHILNVASIAGRLGSPFEAAYSASKFAVVGFTEALALEVAPFGVKASVVNPGPVDTGFFSARGHPYARRSPRPVPAADVAKAVLGALERQGFEKTVPKALRFAVIARQVLPRPYLFATRQAFRAELARLARELEQATEAP
ncbi:MAG: SDR family NAD(P)-dependent oxidoreductase [Acidimicrobiales bacterium]